MGRNKISNSIHPSKPKVKPKSTQTTSKKHKPNKLKALGVMGTKKLIQDKESSAFENALVSVRGKTFKISSDRINKFLGISIKIVSERLDVDNIDNLTLMGRTLCEDDGFEWGKRAFIGQSELTKVSAFQHPFVCENLVGSTNASELNKEKNKIVYALVTNKSLNLGDLLIEHIESAATSSRLDKKLAFSGFLTHFCMKLGVPILEDDVLLPPLKKFCDKRLVFMSFKEKGKAIDTCSLFGEHHETCVVTSTNSLPEWAMHFQERLMTKIRELDAEVVELSAKVIQQDETIKDFGRQDWL
ncbi:hypothetical protein Dsin_017218 [Dipteronia sinensis]|uniref:Putative plant transposon protein domain-containing protein n=1 Tax=Dipteronia sinensis TaxID=43782 RepID=A0AAE0E6H1_9ROSI|nr:hypothetical protein Dsin_017218 [Dipteronia sinensis]